MTNPRQGPRRETIETLTLTNTATTPCRIGGERARQHYRLEGLAPDKVTDVLAVDGVAVVAPGGSETTEITTSSTFGFDDQERCRPRQIGAFRVIPPAPADSVVVAVPAREVCTNPVVGTFLEAGAFSARG